MAKQVHKGIAYDGEHEAILDIELWDRVHALSVDNRQDKVGRAKTSTNHLLKGRLFTGDGALFQTNHACKQGKRYRYYVASCGASKTRLPALDLDVTIAAGLRQRLGVEGQYPDDQILALVERCEIENDEAKVILVPLDSCPKGMECISDRFIEELDFPEPISIPIQIKKRHGETRIRLPGQEVTKPRPDSSLIKAVIKGYAWREQLENGSFSSVRELARDAGFTHRYVGRLLRLAWLAPDIIEAILDGTHPAKLSLENFRQPISADWNKQRRSFGF